MYGVTRNDAETFLQMDGFWNPACTTDALIAAFGSDNWQVQQAAASAVGDRGLVDLLPAMVSLLEQQDRLPVYGCPDVWEMSGAKSVDERETWRCRFRVKQAILIAMLRCVEHAGPGIIDDTLLRRLLELAVSQEEDYPVRMAACELLGRLDRPPVRAVLEAAAADGEWCTATTARKSLVRLGKKV